MYLIGALHADLGMYERAIEELTEAIKLVPEIGAAHFQLGLLHAMAGRTDDAANAWSALQNSAENDPYRIFSDALSAVINEDFESAVPLFERGLALNEENPALNIDMQSILTEVRTNLSESTQFQVETNVDDREASVSKMFLAAYQQDDEEPH